MVLSSSSVFLLDSYGLSVEIGSNSIGIYLDIHGNMVLLSSIGFLLEFSELFLKI